jgi:phosphatidylglycerol:prolipoprotein diacylglycerol transferase
MFHLYGLIIGVASITTLLLAEKKLHQHHFSPQLWWQVVPWLLLGALIGARLYHVLTDYQLYLSQPWQVFALWQGGLSIIGAVIGAAVTLLFVTYWKRQWNQSLLPPLVIADVMAFALPVGQAIGRLGNWVNQELYGLPTNLPWAIYIDPAHRFPAYINQSYYHPLFAYEALPLLFFTLYLWLQDQKSFYAVGQGWYFTTYLFFYGLLRFCLDYLRIDKSFFFGGLLGKNQVVMLILVIVSARILYTFSHSKNKILCQKN